jgi:hypothetical protein
MIANMAETDERFTPGFAPIVLVYHLQASPEHIGFSCPWCKRVHTHGSHGGDGSRASHCIQPSSPLFGRGVVLFYAGDVASARTIPRLSKFEMTVLSNLLNRAGVAASGWRPDRVP